MARIFTIDFQFRGSSYAAVVSTWKGDAHAECFQAMLYDDVLHHLVPDGVVRFSMADENGMPPDAACAELVQCLKKAVNGYVHKLPVASQGQSV